QPVETMELAHQTERFLQRERGVPPGAISPSPLRQPKPVEMLPELRQRVLHPGIVEHRLLELFQLAALLGRQAFHDRLHLRRLPRDLLQELVETLDAREHLSPAIHEALDVRLATRRLLTEQAVQITEHLPEAVLPLRSHALEPLLHLAEQALGHL